MVEAAEKPIVLVTGVSGFLGSATAKAFLDDGGFRVRGTVRSTANEGKLQPIKTVLGDVYDQLELVEADLMDKDSLIKAAEGCTFVAHTASPISGGDDEDSYVKPAVNGTNYIMEACKLAGVKRVVITSSLIAVMAVDPN